MRQCFDAATVNPARILQLDGYGIVPGGYTDFVLLHARDAVEALRLRATGYAAEGVQEGEGVGSESGAVGGVEGGWEAWCAWLVAGAVSRNRILQQRYRVGASSH